MRYIVFFLLFLTLGCTAAETKLYQDDPMTLKKFPLDMATKEEIVASNGLPKRIIKLSNENDAWIYEFGNGDGLTTYTVMFSGRKVLDIIYNDRGPYNGITVRSLQMNK